MDQTKVKHILHNSFNHSSGIIFGKLFSFFTKFYAIKIIGLEQLGVLALLNLMTPYLSYCYSGISFSLPKIIGELQAKNELKEISKNQSTNNIFSIFVSLTLIIIFALFVTFIHDSSKSIFTKTNLILAFIIALLTQLTTLINNHFFSMGKINKVLKNAAAVRIISPIISLILLIKLGLNGMLLGILFPLLLSFLSLIKFAYINKINFFQFSYFNRSILLRNIKLGFSMMFSKKFSEILLTILTTVAGLNFSKTVIGSFSIIFSIYQIISGMFGALYTSLERKIYVSKPQFFKLKKTITQYLFILTSSMTFSILCVSFSVSEFIPIFFNELIDYMNLIPYLGLMSLIFSELQIFNLIINKLDYFSFRNLISILSLAILFFLLKIIGFNSIIEYLIVSIIILLVYKLAIIIYIFFRDSDIQNSFSILISQIISNSILFTVLLMMTNNNGILNKLLFLVGGTLFSFFIYTFFPKRDFKEFLDNLNA